MSEAKQYPQFDSEQITLDEVSNLIHLNNIEVHAAENGDIVKDLTTIAGTTISSKKGDFNYLVKSIDRIIAIEARDRETTSTPATLIKELDQTEENRNADFTIYLVANEDQLHKQVGIYQEYDGNKIVTHFGLLKIALKVAISKMLMTHESMNEIDKASVEKEISNIETTLKKFSGLKSAATNIRNEADKITTKAEEIKKDIVSSLENLNNLLF